MNSITAVAGHDSQMLRLRRPMARNNPSTIAIKKPIRVIPTVLSEARSKSGRICQA
ncbi:hypothetical protein D3C85_1777200 [compost metagenome]